ncbi:MAG: hypothetical protein AAB408_05030 [Patescibacteria group bacterium]
MKNNLFKKGLILGGLLAAGAAVSLAMTKEGRKLTASVQKDLKMLTQNLKKNLANLKDVTQENFEAMVDEVVTEYAREKKLASEVQQTLRRTLKRRWQEMQEEYKKMRPRQS